MSGPGYPREWFRVDRFCDEPQPRTMVKETATRLSWRDSYGRPRVEHKRTNYAQWFPTLAEAQAAIDERERAKAEAAANKALRDAAPELLEALEKLLAKYASKCRAFDCPDANRARAAIAKAKGGAT